MSRYAAIKRDPRTRKRKDGTRRAPRYLFISASLIHVKDPETGVRKTLVAKGKTYRRPHPKLNAPASMSARQRRKNVKLVKRLLREAA